MTQPDRGPSARKFGHAVVQQLKVEGARKAGGLDLQRLAGQDDVVEMVVALPFRVRFRVPADRDARRRMEVCCICSRSSGCFGTCCPEDAEED